MDLQVIYVVYWSTSVSLTGYTVIYYRDSKRLVNESPPISLLAAMKNSRDFVEECTRFFIPPSPL